ncbi:MAG: hypothetical protein ACE5QV_04145, partial [Fidelibacterota bacterium]
NPFAPQEGIVDETSTIILTKQHTPEDVLLNFRYSYIYRDSLIYSRLIDTSFVFIYFDPDEGTSGRFMSWGRDLELRTTSRLFKAFDNLNLVWNSTVNSLYFSEVDTIPSPSFFDDAVQAQVSKSFELTVGSEIKIVGNAVFSFKRYPPSKVWKITKWRDESIF